MTLPSLETAIDFRPNQDIELYETEQYQEELYDIYTDLESKIHLKHFPKAIHYTYEGKANGKSFPRRSDKKQYKAKLYLKRKSNDNNNLPRYVRFEITTLCKEFKDLYYAKYPDRKIIFILRAVRDN